MLYFFVYFLFPFFCIKSDTVLFQVAPLAQKTYADTARRVRESREPLRRGLEQVLQKVLDVRQQLQVRNSLWNQSVIGGITNNIIEYVYSVMCSESSVIGG